MNRDGGEWYMVKASDRVLDRRASSLEGMGGAAAGS